VRIILMAILSLSFLSNLARNPQDEYLLDLTKPVSRKERKKSGSMGGSSASMEGDSRRQVINLKLTLLSLDKQDYRLGDYVICEVRLHNISKSPVFLPWSADYDKVKPNDEKTPPGFLSAFLNLTAMDENEGLIFFNGVSIYGSALLPGSIKQLDPGKSVRIKMRPMLTIGSADVVDRIVKRLPFKMKLNARFASGDGSGYKAYMSEHSIGIELQKRSD
jgi:hypothetical protein